MSAGGPDSSHSASPAARRLRNSHRTDASKPASVDLSDCRAAANRRIVASASYHGASAGWARVTVQSAWAKWVVSGKLAVMKLDRDALEHLDRAALLTLVLTQQARISALETQVATLAAQVNELRGAPPAAPAGPQEPAFVTPPRPAKPAKRARKRRQGNVEVAPFARTG